jgi:undecaprenyl-diphosphatase
MLENKYKNILLIIFSFIFFLIITILSNNSLDRRVHNLINKNLNNTVVIFMKLITLLGDIQFILTLFIITLIILIRYKKYKEALILNCAVIGHYILIWFIKHIIQKPRPENILISASSYSFPSGHATTSIVFYGFFIYIINKYVLSKKIKTVLFLINVILILLIGFSRIYLNAHWFIDVIGGYALGFFWLLNSIFITNLAIKNV